MGKRRRKRIRWLAKKIQGRCIKTRVKVNCGLRLFGLLVRTVSICRFWIQLGGKWFGTLHKEAKHTTNVLPCPYKIVTGKTNMHQLGLLMQRGYQTFCHLAVWHIEAVGVVGYKIQASTTKPTLRERLTRNLPFCRPTFRHLSAELIWQLGVALLPDFICFLVTVGATETISFISLSVGGASNGANPASSYHPVLANNVPSCPWYPFPFSLSFLSPASSSLPSQHPHSIYLFTQSQRPTPPGVPYSDPP